MDWMFGVALLYIIGASENRLYTCHSYHVSESSKTPESKTYTKSDLNFSLATSSVISGTSNATYLAEGKFKEVLKINGDYYKKYEHDKVPVKDSHISNNKYVRAIKKSSLTNSDLNNLEKRIFSNISQELQTDDVSLTSLESNIKFFKLTVEKIFERFYTSMQDFEHYKKRFHEILDKNSPNAIDDMEDFIKDMFEHIISSDISASQISCRSTGIVVSDRDERYVDSCGDSSVESENGKRIVEAYKNTNYLTDSTLPNDCIKTKLSEEEDKLNIFLLGGNSCVKIKLGGHHMLSEIDIQEPTKRITSASIASADNLRTLAAKKLEIENYITQQREGNMPDRDIPVKISYAKKNIYLNEDFATRIRESSNNSQSFLSKICKILCRKFRKSSTS